MSRKHQLLSFIPLFILACCSCGSHGGKQDAVKNHWYKRYTGTVAGQPVVANLFFDGDKDAPNDIVSVGGNYYYRNKSDLIDLQQDEESEGSEILLTEYAPKDDNNNKSKHSQWRMQITDSGITGTWLGPDGSQKGMITLKENYGPGSYAFDVISVQDSVSFKSKQEEYQMNTEYNLLAPAANVDREDAQFITKALLHELGGDTLGAGDFKAFIAASNKNTFKEYTGRLTRDPKDTSKWNGPMSDIDETIDGTLEYNDRGIVVFGFATTVFGDNGHQANWNRYITLDVKGRKALQLGDILSVDTAKLQALLDQAAKIKFGINPGDSLTSKLLVKTIPLTANFIISETGITFHYNPDEIASHVYGDFYLCFSYSQLGEMVRPEFIKRMQQ